MDYKQARSSIKTGDLIAIRTAHNWLGWLTQFFTRSPYTHCGIALWIDNGLYLAELNGGRNHITPLSQWVGTDFDVYDPPLGLNHIIDSIFFWLRVPVDYGFIAFVTIGLLHWFRIKKFVHWRQNFVCSGWCVAVYEESGWPEHSRMLSPQDLTELLSLKLEVRL